MKDKKKFWLIFSVATVVLFVWMIRYKAINQDYRQRWSANTEKTYSVGEIVPIAPDGNFDMEYPSPLARPGIGIVVSVAP